MQNSPGANPILGGWRGGCAGPAGPPVLTPCSPSGAGRGARRLPEGRCPPALLTSEDSVCGVEAVVVQEQPLLSPPLTKNKPQGASAPHPADRGQGMRENTQAQPTLPGGVARGTLRKEGTSSINVTGMQTPVSQERRGCSLPKVWQLQGPRQRPAPVPRSLPLSLGSSIQLENK